MQAYLQESPLWADLEIIFSRGGDVPAFMFKGYLHTVDHDIEVMNIASIDFARDYVNKIGDEIVIKFHIPFGDYMLDVYPHRNNMEFTLIRTTLVGNGYRTDTTQMQQIERYKAVFIPDANNHSNLSSFNTIDRFTLNNQAPVELSMQLLNRTLEPLRIKTTQGVFGNVTREDLIRGILGGETAKIYVDGKPGIDAFNIISPDNTEHVKQIIFPNNTPVLAVPTYMQERHTGVYTAGIGNYFQTYNDKRTWFVYPLFDTRRFSEPVPKLIVYAVPSQQYSGMDRTYRVNDTTLHVVGTGGQKYQDDGEASQMQQGIGFRQASADAMMDKPVKMTKEGPIGVRNKINTEVSMKYRDDNLNFAAVSSRGISANNFAEYSQHLINNGARIDISWHNSDPSLLYPGMPCKYVYMDDSEMQEVCGVLIANHTLITTGNKQTGIKMTDTNYSVSTMLTLFVEKFNEVKDAA